MQRTALIVILTSLCIVILFHARVHARQKRIMFVASYHTDKGEWTAGIKSGIDGVLAPRKDVALKVYNMDTRLARSEDAKKKAALAARDAIASWTPDVVITSDDNAAKYLILPYYKDAALPFVFCGLNWDASVYGLPYENTTGMVEVQLIRQIVSHLSAWSEGERIGALRGDTLTNRKEHYHFEKQLGRPMEVRFVTDLDGWKRRFVELQEKVDMLVLGSLRALDLQGVPLKEIEAFVAARTRIPTAAYDAFMKDISLLVLSTVPEEQGRWAARKALEILDGKPPAEIPVQRNREGKLHLNMKIAKQLNIRFPMELIESAHLSGTSPARLLYVNSYRKGLRWSDDIERGLFKALDITVGPDGSPDDSRSKVEFRLFRMNTKRLSDAASIRKAARTAKTLIDRWRPDIVVVSDDNAVEYLVVPFFRNAELPFVFCGLNRDASVYGLPASNVTGMLEIAPVRETVEMLRPYARGDRIGYIGSDFPSDRREIENHRNLLSIEYADGALAAGFDDWKREYLRLQEAVDMLIFIGPAGLPDWDEQAAEAFVLENTRIPTGCIGDAHARYALLGRVKIAEEQGWWAGKTALRILAGTPPDRIPVTTNRRSRLLINAKLAARLGIRFPVEVLEEASILPTRMPPEER